MVSIDVNTGRFVGKSDPDNTILSANLEAVEEVVRQIQLRDLGGIIVVDFIDMEEASHRKRVFKMLQEALRKDRARTNILHFSDLGLVEMTRQRTPPQPLYPPHGGVSLLRWTWHDSIRRNRCHSVATCHKDGP